MDLSGDVRKNSDINLYDMSKIYSINELIFDRIDGINRMRKGIFYYVNPVYPVKRQTSYKDF